MPHLVKVHYGPAGGSYESTAPLGSSPRILLSQPQSSAKKVELWAEHTAKDSALATSRAGMPPAAPATVDLFGNYEHYLLLAAQAAREFRGTPAR